MATSRYRYTPPPPPWSCPMCLVGACHRCTGRLTVQQIAGPARDVPCKHKHTARRPIATDRSGGGR